MTLKYGDITINEYAVREINKEHWKYAKGIKAHRTETNSALALRDYSIDCKLTHQICVIKGYFIWWCFTHHQPFYLCEREINNE